MGKVIRFPIERRQSSNRAELQREGCASIVILPVVRIERHGATEEGPKLGAKSNAAPVGTGVVGG